jgi:hypothetical protein
VLSVVSLALGVVAAVAAPTLGSTIVGEEFDLDRWGVLGWSVYAAATAAAIPYGVLAAVRGRQAATFVVRLVDSALALAGVAIVVAVASPPWSTSAIPYVMGLFALAGGVGIRQLSAAGRSED